MKKPKKISCSEKSRSLLKSERGVALFEMLFLLTTFVILVGITIGLWGSVHSAVLQSIAARHYAFEVINNRPHFEYHRDFDGAAPASSGNMFKGPSTMVGFYGKARQMLFVVTVDDPTAVSSKNPIAATRGINFFYEIGRAPSQNPSGLIKSYRANDVNFHTNSWSAALTPGGVVDVNPIWLMTGYGICLEMDCGD